MQPATVQIGDFQLTFAEIKAWDLIQARREVRDGNGNVDDFEFGLALAWRSAVAGGFNRGFKDFGEMITAQQLDNVLEVAKPFFAKAQAARPG